MEESLQVSSRVQRRKQQMKEKIIVTAVRLFQTQGFEQTTMELIAEEADIARKTLYNYFPVKEAILGEHVQSLMAKEQIYLEEFFKELPDTRSRLLAGFKKGAEWIKSNAELYKVYIQFRFQIVFKSNTATDYRSGYQDLLYKVLDAGQKLGDIRTDLSLEILSRQLEMFFLIPVISWLNSLDTFPLEQSLKENVDLFLNGASKQQIRNT